MCIAIYKPAGKTIPEQQLREAYVANPDGWGYSFYADFSGIKVFQSVIIDFELFYYSYKVWEELQHLIHFRTASSGKIGEQYCHPFYVNDNLVFVQNGNLPEFGVLREQQDDRTDIQRFNDEVLKKWPDNFLEIPKYRNLLERYNKECMSKMIFMDSAGKVTIINEQAGEWVDGCWYSNGGIDNYIGYGYSGAYYYKSDEIRHKGGVLSVQMLGSDRRKQYRQCANCFGWFKGLEEDCCNGCQTYLELFEV